MLTLLHTSDWHLGRRLYGKARYAEFEQFLTWQLAVINAHHVDVLLIAGDIFDTSSPSNQAQTLYYRFLHDVSQTACRHVVIVGGNHDSPSFLDAPHRLLKGFNIHVVGSMRDNLDDEILVLNNPNGTPELIIVAVPYLRDRDVRTVANGERLDDKENKLATGIREHYKAVTELAKQRQHALERQFNKKIPLIGTGHLFATGGVTVEGDGVRELYVGSLAHVGADMFDPALDYVALGHLHVPQAVGGQAHIRYSGSPIAMGFGESNQQKQMHLVRFFADENLLNQPLNELRKNRSLELPLAKEKKTSQVLKHKTMSLFDDEFDDEFEQTEINQPTIEPITVKNLDLDNVLNLPFYQPYNLAKLGDTTLLQSLAVPTFQPLMTLKGDWQTLKTQIDKLKKSKHSVWLEIVYDSDTVMGDLREQVNALVKGTSLEVIRLKNLQVRNQTLQAQTMTETLEELDEQQVFERCLTAHHVSEEQKPVMWERYAEVLESLKEIHL